MTATFSEPLGAGVRTMLGVLWSGAMLWLGLWLWTEHASLAEANIPTGSVLRALGVMMMAGAQFAFHVLVADPLFPRVPGSLRDVWRLTMGLVVWGSLLAAGLAAWGVW